MKMKNTRKEQAKATKKMIFNTAVDLIKKYGYHNVTVSEICKEAGIAKGSFYVHYNSKEDIIRESYYSDMSEYILSAYKRLLIENSDITIKEKIIAFLGFELDFAEYSGYELTCLAYSMNLSACIPGPSEHFEKRVFTSKLYELLESADMNQQFTLDEAFEYLETMVRGIMATWCFSNKSFTLVNKGNKFIEQLVNSIIL